MSCLDVPLLQICGGMRAQLTEVLTIDLFADILTMSSLVPHGMGHMPKSLTSELTRRYAI